MTVAVMMVMIVRVAVIVCMIMRMIVAAAAGLIMSMIVVIIVPVVRMTMMRVHLVGAAFRLERRVDHRHLGAERLEQFFGRRRAQRAHAVRQQLHGDVAIAEMPGDARQRRNIGGPRFDQRFRFGDDLDEAAVVERDDVVVPQPVLEVDVNRLALDAGDAERAGGALGMIEQYTIGGGQTTRGMSGDDAGGARHDGCDPELTS